MRAVILLGLVGLLGLASGEVSDPLLGYHTTVGIPEAKRIRADEQAAQAATAEDFKAGRIVGGAVATLGSNPYLGGLVISLIGAVGSSVCGSSLLTANRLVTAAHCWNDGFNQAWRFEVVLGSQFLFSGGTRIATSNVIMHSQWSPATLANDVAMIYLPNNVAFSQLIQPVALPLTTQISDDFTGFWAVAAGYGKTSDAQTGVTTATQISQVTLQVISTTQCQSIFGVWAQSSNICTSGAGAIGICGGDSGGPLVLNSNGQRYLVGISSFVASAGCQLGFPSAFARVTSFYSFIVSHL